MQIAIPVGQYAPVFLRCEDSAAPESTKPATPSNDAARIVDEENGHLQIDPADSRPLDTQTVSSTAAPITGGAPARRVLVWAALAAMSLMIALLAAFRPWSSARSPLANAAEPSSSPAPAIENAAGAAAELSEIRILAGAKTSKYVDHGGKVWLGDRYFNGGSVSSAAVSLIYRTQDPEIYQTNRHGDFSYDIPLKPGNYELRLHFAETFYGPEGLQGGGEVSRLFLVRANGQPLVRPLDVYSDAGGWRTAEIKVFKNISPAADGFLHLEFLSWTHGKAFVNAIEALPAKPGAINPVRIVVRETPFYSADG
ncbi:MAG: malectin, partial [Blastocatellia bacterium]